MQVPSNSDKIKTLVAGGLIVISLSLSLASLASLARGLKLLLHEALSCY
jgi:hypothetical protein